MVTSIVLLEKQILSEMKHILCVCVKNEIDSEVSHKMYERWLFRIVNRENKKGERGLKLEVDRRVHANEIIFEQKRWKNEISTKRTNTISGCSLKKFLLFISLSDNWRNYIELFFFVVFINAYNGNYPYGFFSEKWLI